MENGIIERNNRKGFVITILILLLILFGLSGYIVYDKFLSYSDKPIENKNNFVIDGKTTMTTTTTTTTTASIIPINTTLSCISNQEKVSDYTYSYIETMEFKKNVFFSYERVETYIFENATDYYNAKNEHGDIDRALFNDINLIKRIYIGLAYGKSNGKENGFKNKTIEDVKKNEESETVICSIQN